MSPNYHPNRGIDAAKQLKELQTFAEDAVRAGMSAVKQWQDEGRDLGAEEVGGVPGDEYVTAVDYASEDAVRAILQTKTPRIPIIGEMNGDGEREQPRVWVVDPVDGTTNLVRGNPFVAVTVALLDDGVPLVGATGCPFTSELWSAARGCGAHDAAGTELKIEEAPSELIALDPQQPSDAYAPTWSDAMSRLENEFEEVRPLGAIALEMAYVAAGRFGGFVQLGTRARAAEGSAALHDFAAGVVLVREAGGIVTGLDGRDDVWRSEVVLAGAPAIHRRLERALAGFSVPA